MTDAKITARIIRTTIRRAGFKASVRYTTTSVSEAITVNITEMSNDAGAVVLRGRDTSLDAIISVEKAFNNAVRSFACQLIEQLAVDLNGVHLSVNSGVF